MACHDCSLLRSRNWCQRMELRLRFFDDARSQSCREGFQNPVAASIDAGNLAASSTMNMIRYQMSRLFQEPQIYEYAGFSPCLLLKDVSQDLLIHPGVVNCRVR